ncbi:MAG: ribonuclease HIII [Chlamydiae bacterium]|nr:ribonuclease HIII [Chlamydiota bacterium]MBI3266992.1 ribonuclease HIII [Chlamydiota bacterium]
MNPVQKNYYVCVLEKSQALQLKKALDEKDFEYREIPYAQWAAFRKDLNIVFYSKGKLVVQGKGMAEFVQFFLEPEILQKMSFGYEGELAQAQGSSHAGVDESGKGDYFGPLVVASVYVEKDKIARLVQAGVKDSKKLSEPAIRILSQMIKTDCPFSLVVMGPERYNKLYEKIKNLNRMLAWGHARAIENILEKVSCSEVMLDQFGDERLVLNALMEEGRKVKLTQRHHGEEDIAVAAASIVARHEFVTRLEELGKETGMELPRGAGVQVENVAKKIFEKNGLEGLSKVAKIHFKFTEKIISHLSD